jgi:hypothetical protein
MMREGVAMLIQVKRKYSVKSARGEAENFPKIMAHNLKP